MCCHVMAQSYKLQACELIHGHTSVAVRPIYAALEVGQAERGSVTGTGGSERQEGGGGIVSLGIA